jgi:hypothetical protein
MRPEDLHLFSRQLALWAESAITRGRTPFRRVETSPALLTAEGEVRPALVLWINRDSFLAGGILLLPPGESETFTQRGRLCAQALGLRHFATWSPKEIVVWEDQGEEQIRRHRTFAFETGHSPGAFRQALEELLEEFKLLSVLGTVPPEALSPHYFANLARVTLESAFGSVTESARVAQGEKRLPASLSPFDYARRKSSLVLLRLLELLIEDRLPPGIQPERLEQAMLFALEDIPEPLRLFLSPGDEELPLCPEAAVRFHHLLRRLGQLRFGADRTRAVHVLEILLKHEAAQLGGHPLPALPTSEGPHLLLHADRLVPSPYVVAEIAPLPLLALHTLLRILQDLPLPQIGRESCFALTRSEIPSRIVGTLNDRSLPSASQRQFLLGHLRTSWPNRRFPLPPHTPRWVWEFLHLLGLAPEGSRVDLHLPCGWLSADFATILLTVICENYTLTDLHHSKSNLRLRLIRDQLPNYETRLSDPSGEKFLPWKRLRDSPPPLCCLILGSPAVFSPLLQREEGLLHSAESADWGGQRRQILRFSRTSLGRHLWKIASGGATLPDDSSLEEEARQYGWPVPTPEILDRLEGVPESVNESAALDREIARRMDLPTDFPAMLCSAGTSSRARVASPKSLARVISANVFADGIPLFPEQYLYDYYRPDLESFSFTGALHIEENFFGQITLCDAEGVRITVNGEESARALELASYSGRVPVALPRDPTITGAILDRYLHDLHHLKQMLLRQTHLRAADARAAETLAQRIWKSLPLPPWFLLEQ